MRLLDQSQRLYQARQQFAEFAFVIRRQRTQHPVALGRHLELHSAAIGGVMQPLQQTRLFTSIAEFDDAVMAQAQSFRGVRHRGLNIFGGAGDLQQKLMLLGLQAGLLGAPLAEGQELAERVAELSQRLETITFENSYSYDEVYRDTIHFLQAVAGYCAPRSGRFLLARAPTRID